MRDKLMSDREHAAGPRREAVRCAVVTVSSASSPETDYGGRTVAYQLVTCGHTITRRWIVPDDARQIDEAIRDVSADVEVDALILVGGTGLSQRDATYEVVARKLHKRLDGFAHAFHYVALKEFGTESVAARVIAGSIGAKIVMALPRDRRFCELAVERLVVPELANLVREAKQA